MKIIKELKGYSGSQVLLIHDRITFVRKIGNIERNLERYGALSSLGLNLPIIINRDINFYDMEYIPNLDIKNFLFKNQTHSLSDFIKNTVHKLSEHTTTKDYTEIYQQKLQGINFKGLVFDKDTLINKLPKILPSSEYHGDLTLENILYNVTKGEFILIDPLTTEYDSYVFDLAKLRQDIVCKWFIRKESSYIESKLQNLSEELELEFEHYSDPYLLILMLLRVLPYAQKEDQKFLIKEANKLWK
jgi:tRNA A-37 threonylcarbamoyl transferase component Bud32